jgi:hypothetical protein
MAMSTDYMSLEPSPESLPVFIGGFRSGTTLLVNLLGLHPELSAWFETKGLCEALRLLRVLRSPASEEQESGLVRPASITGFSVDAVARRMLSDFRETAARQSGHHPSGKAPGERYPLGHDLVHYSLKEAEAAVETWRAALSVRADTMPPFSATGCLIRELGKRHRTQEGKPIWINKTPEIIRFMPELRMCLGPCRFIMVIRDGRGVVRSAARLGWAEAAEIGIWWKAMIEEARSGASADPDNYLEVRYEDLMSRPTQQLDEIHRFLGVESRGGDSFVRYLRELNIETLSEASSAWSDSPSQVDIANVELAVDAEFNARLGY